MRLILSEAARAKAEEALRMAIRDAPNDTGLRASIKLTAGRPRENWRPVHGRMPFIERGTSPWWVGPTLTWWELRIVDGIWFDGTHGHATSRLISRHRFKWTARLWRRRWIKHYREAS